MPSSPFTPPPADAGLRVVELDRQPAEVFHALRAQPGLVFLDSATADHPGAGNAGGEPSAPRYSLLAARPVEVVRGHITKPAALRAALSRHRPSRRQSPAVDLGFPIGGAIGWIDYDGSFCFGIYADVLLFDHRSERWIAQGNLTRYLDWQFGDEAAPLPDGPADFRSRLDADDFCRLVRRTQEYIAAGDIYQVNLSHRFRADWPAKNAAATQHFYHRLRDASPASYGAYLDLAGRKVLSSSPELFLELSGSLARTRPIKGTRPRFRDPELDEKSAYDLITSPKEIAELIMITDLERNDLGRICEYGSVRAAELLKLERHEHVFHLVSTVEGQLRPDVDHLDAIAACFPGGSITGAPKKRAMEIIDELEPEPRGLYTGAIGIIGFDVESRLSIAIRTAVAEAGELHFHVGAGIVADSDPCLEYEETLHKARGLFAANQAKHPDSSR